MTRTVVGEMLKAATAIMSDGQVVELRAIQVPSGNGYVRSYAGWFDDPELLAKEAAHYDSLEPKYVSMSINPVNPDLLARAANKMKVAEKGMATSDSEIIERRWLPIDIDPIRLKGVSSTDEEKQSSVDMSFQVMDYLSGMGWPEPIMADSGNGTHLLYKIDLPNNKVSEELVKNCLLALADKFDNAESSVDTKLANASRVVKVYGGKARKGDSIKTRPHRRSEILILPENPEFVTLEQLQNLAEQAPKLSEEYTPREFDGNTKERTIFERARLYLAECDASIEGSGGDHTLFRAACYVANDFGLNDSDALTLLMEWNQRCIPPWPIRDLKEKISNARHHAKQSPGARADAKMPERERDYSRSTDKPKKPASKKPEIVFEKPDEEFSGTNRDYFNTAKDTDTGNAERLVAGSNGMIKYSAARGWHSWEGRHWVPDEMKVKQIYHDLVVEKIYQEAAESIEPGSGKYTQKLVKWAMKSEAKSAIQACLQVASSFEEVVVKPMDMDADPFLFCCDNATIDLKTGEARDHRPEDLMTRISNVKYIEGATCPKWEQFLSDIFGGDAELIEYLQMAVGYSLTASTREQCFFILYGSGKNGKSVFMNTLNSLFGTYAMETPPETLMRDRNNSNRPTNDIARLAGTRCVSANETEEGQSLAESKIKALTGDDIITARYLHKEFFEFRPQFKIWIRTNHKPRIRGTDEGIWRRVHLIPFLVKISKEKQDKNLSEKLAAELPGILNWAITGCVAWQNVGLSAPTSVLAATDEYKNSQDLIGLFLNEHCIVNPDGATGRTSLRELYDSYCKWCEDAGERPMSKRNLSFRLVERGMTKRRCSIKGNIVFDGVALIDEETGKPQQGSFYTGARANDWGG